MKDKFLIIMKKLFFIFTLALGLMSFTSNDKVEVNQNLENLNIIEVLETSTFDFCTRTCYYRNGVLIRYSDWDCTIILPEIIL